MHKIATRAALALLAVAGAGCGATKAPEVAMQDIVRDTTRGDLGAVWRALPASYQADVQDLLGRLADKLDPEIYDEGFKLVRAGLTAVREKPDLQSFAPPRMLPPAVAQNTREILDIADALVAGPISTVEGLRELDIGQFLDRAGRAVMTAMREIAAGKGKDIDALFHGLRITVQQRESTTCTLTFASDATPLALPVPFEMVEGKWIPVALTKAWPNAMREARAKLDAMPSMRTPETRQRMQVDLAKAKKQLEMFKKANSGAELSRMTNPRPGK